MRLEVIARKPVASAERLPLVNQADRHSLFTRFRCYGQSVRSLSREFGLSEEHVQTIIRQEVSKAEANEYARGQRDANAYRPLPPAGGRIVPRRVEVVDARGRKAA